MTAHFGLAAVLWTENLRAAFDFIDRIEAGFVQVNQFSVAEANIEYGGTKLSGTRPRALRREPGEPLHLAQDRHRQYRRAVRNGHVKRIAFIGLGNMGLPMSRNLLAAGFEVIGYDLPPACPCRRRAESGVDLADRPLPMPRGQADCVITMLPTGQDVREAYLADGGLLAASRPGALLIDSSTYFEHA